MRTSEQLAHEAKEIIHKRCGACHEGEASRKSGFDFFKPEILYNGKHVVPNKPSESELIERIEGGSMPPADDQQRAEHVPTNEERVTLKAWIADGAPKFDFPVQLTPPASSVSEQVILQTIVQDLGTVDRAKVGTTRYFSLAHLYNSGYSKDQINATVIALARLLNSLSTAPQIHIPAGVPVPTAEGPRALVVRFNLNDFRWQPSTWQAILAAYPYGIRYNRDNLESTLANQITSASGAGLPYIRADWFIANASLAPLYYQILQLPDSLDDLEKKFIDVDTADNFAHGEVIRGAVGQRADSGVSVNERVLERHLSKRGHPYWKSFDYRRNPFGKRPFDDPIALRPNAGEFIFSLPNGMQAYCIFNFDEQLNSKRANDAVTEIVKDKTNLLDPVVRAGRSCMSCHATGIRYFADEIRPLFKTRANSKAVLDLYPEQQELTEAIAKDSARFAQACREAGAEVVRGAPEPINRVAIEYLGDVPAAAAAGDFGMKVEELRDKLLDADNPRVRALARQLGDSNSRFKRDTWEQAFGEVAIALGIGSPYLRVGIADTPDEVFATLRAALGGQEPFWVFKLEALKGSSLIFRSSDFSIKSVNLAIPGTKLAYRAAADSLHSVVGIETPGFQLEPCWYVLNSDSAARVKLIIDRLLQLFKPERTVREATLKKRSEELSAVMQQSKNAVDPVRPDLKFFVGVRGTTLVYGREGDEFLDLADQETGLDYMDVKCEGSTTTIDYIGKGFAISKQGVTRRKEPAQIRIEFASTMAALHAKQLLEEIIQVLR